MERTSRAQGLLTPAWLRRLALGLLVINILLAAYVLWRSAVLTPYSDQIDWIERWRNFRGDWAAYLFEPINLHRLPMIFGLIAFDIEALGGTNWPLISSGAAALAALAWMLARAAGKAAPPPLALPAAALVVMLALMGSNVLDAATPICVNYIHGVTFAVLAIVLADGGGEGGLTWRRAAALAAAMAAGLGDAAALAVWPVLGLSALRRRDWPWLAALAAAGAAFLGAYAWGQGENTRISTSGALAAPLDALRLTLNFLPLPWTRANIHLAWIGGLAIGLLGLAAIVLRGGREASRSERIAADFILFSLGVALMAGIGRSSGDPLNVPLRYGVLLAPLHAGFVMLALPFASELWRANRSAAQALCAGVLALATVQNLVLADAAIRTNDKVRTIVANFRAGRDPGATTVIVHPRLDRAERAYAEMAREGVYQRELHLKPNRSAR